MAYQSQEQTVNKPEDYTTMDEVGNPMALYVKNNLPRVLFAKGRQFATSAGIHGGLLSSSDPNTETQNYCSYDNAYSKTQCRD